MRACRATRHRLVALRAYLIHADCAKPSEQCVDCGGVEHLANRDKRYNLGAIEENLKRNDENTREEKRPTMYRRRLHLRVTLLDELRQ